VRTAVSRTVRIEIDEQGSPAAGRCTEGANDTEKEVDRGPQGENGHRFLHRSEGK
jgi:hypothetical protein